MDGRAYLEKLIADRLGAGRGQPAAGRRLSFDRTEVRGVAQGLVAAGALRAEEMDRMLADLDATLTAAGWLTVVEHRVGTAGSARPEWTERIGEPPVPLLRRVVPLTGRADPFTLLSLEVWSTILVLRTARVLSASEHRRELLAGSGGRTVDAWDDAGTRYRPRGLTGSGTHGLHFEQWTFEPGPADHAAEVTFATGGTRFTAPLRPS
ncbi:hypothetical protein [Virgisporangium ochraceum]|uniref:Uncharacterized protein n=1 Tax=Virgisporangium ochraceum TaxID=65505 RepID=A0A8J4E9N3_9ACTN|nr:hypothetical protein [Virgisporangium ochraceum]GIJ66896.1 hypothetical protein Voc01_018130 [Virgisporangium ochraceum]